LSRQKLVHAEDHHHDLTLGSAGLFAYDVNTNQTDAAAQKLTEVAARHGGSAPGNRARLYLGDIELKRGNAAAALVQYDAFLKRATPADFLWTVGQRGKAIALENQSKFAEAATAFEALARGNMGMEEQARAMLDAAQARSRAGDKNAALATYDRLLKEYPYSRATAAAKLGKAELSAVG
jgi:outer membrane protein assembly factor BamD (BamD/ComL family)